MTTTTQTLQSYADVNNNNEDNFGQQQVGNEDNNKASSSTKTTTTTATTEEVSIVLKEVRKERKILTVSLASICNSLSNRRRWTRE